MLTSAIGSLFSVLVQYRSYLSFCQQVLSQNEGENYIYGMLAFPLLELGRMVDAEKAAEKAFEINKEDPWAHHAVSFLYRGKGNCLYRLS